MKKILVTGGDGQLAQCIKDLVAESHLKNFIFASSLDLDITDEQHVKRFFNEIKPSWVINCAAYTAVDKAESDQDKAFAVNVSGAKYLAEACKYHSAKLIHISTDFVFDGTSSKSYSDDDQTNPLCFYGSTKLQGEMEISKILSEHFIIRTSWLYSEHGNNFLKTMLRLAKDRSEINVVSDQIGSPTYAKDLALGILKIVEQNSTDLGIYHFANQGVASWYDFAKAIFAIAEIPIKVNPIPTTEYPTPAKRPNFSVLDTSKFKKTFNIAIPYWRDSLKVALENLQ